MVVYIMKVRLYKFVFLCLGQFLSSYRILSMNNLSTPIVNNNIKISNDIYAHFSEGYFKTINTTTIFNVINNKFLESYGLLGKMSFFYNKLDLPKLSSVILLKLIIDVYIFTPNNRIFRYFNIGIRSYREVSNFILLCIVLKYYDYFTLE